MPVNQRRLAEIMLEQCEHVEERCPGYRGAVIDHLIGILDAEYSHKTGGGINIRKRVMAQCEALGRFLAKNRGHNQATDE